METWVKFQIDYIERNLNIKFNPEELEFWSWYLKLSKEEQRTFNKIRTEIKKNEKLFNSIGNSGNPISNIPMDNI